MKYLSILCVVINFFTIITCQSSDGWYFPQDDDENCSTPNRQRGICIPIRECAAIIYWISKKSIPPETVAFIRQSQCGYHFDGSPTVCCPTSGKSPGRITTRRPPTNPRPQPPTNNNNNNNAVNYNLLPDTNVCGSGPTTTRIYGGVVALIDDYPWMALLNYAKPHGNGFHCGGVLINKRYVLTASHCVNGRDIPRDWRLDSVRLGEFDTSTDIDCVTLSITNGTKFCAPKPIDVKIEQRIPHPDYDPLDFRQQNDIALLRLINDVQYSDFILPICLPINPIVARDNFEGTNVYVSGWGRTENKADSDKKLKLRIPMVKHERCKDIYKSKLKLTSSQICAGGEEGRDTCRGDSGGPLMSFTGPESNWYVIGIVSFGPNDCGTKNWPGVYTRVSNFVPWIGQTIRP